MNYNKVKFWVMIFGILTTILFFGIFAYFCLQTLNNLLVIYLLVV